MIYLDDKKIEVGKFPDGTILIKEDVKKDFNSLRDIRISWFFESNEEFVTLIYITRHLQEHGIKNIHLYMPYIPNARQDRVKTDEDVFTLKYFAEIINWLNFTSVTVVDPHSAVSEALINRVNVITPSQKIKAVIEKIKSLHNNENADSLMMFYPDEGAMKRYSDASEMKYAFGIKRRNWKTGKIEGLDVSGCVDEIKDKRILIVDDICSRGGTFYHSAKKLKELGAREIYLYVTHCENTVLEGELLTSGLIEKIFTTNSIFTKTNEKIEVL